MLNHRPNTRISPDFFLTISSKDYRSATELAIHRSIKCRDPQSLNTMHSSGQNWAHSHYSLSSGCIFSVFKETTPIGCRACGCCKSASRRTSSARPAPRGLALIFLRSCVCSRRLVPPGTRQRAGAGPACPARLSAGSGGLEGSWRAKAAE